MLSNREGRLGASCSRCHGVTGPEAQVGLGNPPVSLPSFLPYLHRAVGLAISPLPSLVRVASEHPSRQGRSHSARIISARSINGRAGFAFD